MKKKNFSSFFLLNFSDIIRINQEVRNLGLLSNLEYYYRQKKYPFKNSQELQAFPDQLSFVAIIKNEAPYIAEWLEFHRMLGVDRFYIYDNNSNDDVMDVLDSYIKEGIVVYKYCPGTRMQLKAYQNAVDCYKMRTKYMGFIDLDEFVFPVNENNLVNVMDEIMRQDSHSAGVGINWRIYGSNGYQLKQEGLVTEVFKKRAFDSHKANRHIKTICNPRKVTGFITPHNPEYLEGLYNISEQRKKIVGPFNFNGTCERIRINHYFTKSYDEFLSKRERGKADSFGIRSLEDFNDHNQDKIVDEIIDRFLPYLKERLQLQKSSQRKI